MSTEVQKETPVEKVEEIQEVESENEDQEIDAKNPSRNEKKAKKLLLKLGLKRVEGIARVAIKRTKNVVFAISQPEVYVNSTGDSYVVFGEAKVEDLTAQAHAATRAITDKLKEKQPTSSISEVSGESDEPANEDGLETKDIEMIMEQAGVSRPTAVKSLRDHQGDLVNAIMSLTM